MAYSEQVTFDSRKSRQEPGHRGHRDLGKKFVFYSTCSSKASTMHSSTNVRMP